MVDEKGQCLVKNFIVGREDYGEVKFLGVTDVKDLNLDKIGKPISLVHRRIVHNFYQISEFGGNHENIMELSCA